MPKPAAKSKLSEMDKVKTIQFWATLGVSLLAAGFVGAMYLNRYAHAEDLKAISNKFDDHVQTEGVRQAVLEEQQKRNEEDWHATLEQLQEIAKSVRARIVPQPQHETRDMGE